MVCKKDARKLREVYVCLTGRADMLREAVLEDQKIEPCLKQPLRLLKAASDGKSEAETPANGLYTEILENPERYFQDRKKELPYLDYLEMTECQRGTNLKQMLRKPGNGSLCRKKKSLKFTCRRDCGCIRGQERYIRENAAES